MAKGTVNKVVLLGRLGQDPEVRYMPSGVAVLNISLATVDGYKDAQTGQFIDNTEWHRVVIFGKQAETVQQYVRKGGQLFVEGRLRTNKWTDQNGVDRYTTEIVANQVQMIGGQQSQGGAPLPNYIPANAAMPSSAPVQQQPQNNATAPTGAVGGNDYAKAKGGKPAQGEPSKQPDLAAMDFDDDDIPF